MSDKKQQTRQRILTSAERQLLRRGPLAPGVGEVMGEAGLTVGGFYAHFASKEALMQEAFEGLLSRRRQALKTLEPELPAAERRALMAAFYLSRRHRDSQTEAEGCPLPSSLSELQALPESFRQALEHHLELLMAEFADAPEEADKVLADFSLMVGGLLLARALGTGALSDRVLRAAKSAVI